MPIDTLQIRTDTPACQDKIFMNSAGAALQPTCVTDAVKKYIDEEIEIGGYKLEDIREKEINKFYVEAAKLINAQAKNIAFAGSATDAYIKALSTIPFVEGDVLVTSNDDYASNHIQFLSLRKRHKIQIEKIDNLPNGDLDIEHFEQLISRRKPRLVAISHIPTNSGMIQDVKTVGRICRDHDILYLVDACQSVGQIVVDVDEIKCDFLSATGRKFLRGPRGTGFLYVSDRILAQDVHPLHIDGKGGTWISENTFEYDQSALRFETWEKPLPLMVGCTEALRYCNQIGIHEIEKYNQELSNYFREKLTKIDGLQIYDQGSKKCNIITIRLAGYSLDEMKAILDKHCVYFSVSTLEWGVLDYNKKGVDGTIRLSPHYYNTKEEVDRICEILKAES